VLVKWEPGDPSVCADWDGNEVNGNYVQSFEQGIQWSKAWASAPDCSPTGLPGETPWTGNRTDRNDIRDCHTGIRASTGGLPMKLVFMENHITSGVPFPVIPGCDDTNVSLGMFIGDVNKSDVVSNRIQDVGMGIRLGYRACWTRIRNNQVRTTQNGNAAGIRLCPSHCNWMIDNELSAVNSASSTGIEFRDVDLPTPCFNKQHGTHILDGGLIHDLQFVTGRRTTATVNIVTPPGRARYAQIDNPCRERRHRCAISRSPR
jgi:hypothetical protein